MFLPLNFSTNQSPRGLTHPKFKKAKLRELGPTDYGSRLSGSLRMTMTGVVRRHPPCQGGHPGCDAHTLSAPAIVGEGQHYGLWAMSTAKPRPPLAPGEARTCPVLPLRDIVVFPHMVVHLFVGRKKSILALEEVIRSGTFILLATQKNATDDEPATEAIYEVGTLASVLQLLKLPNGTVKILVEGGQRAKVVKYTDCNGYYEAKAVVLLDTMGERVEAKALARVATADFENYAKRNKKVPPEVVGVVQQIEDHAKLADTIASHLALKIPDQQTTPESSGRWRRPSTSIFSARS